MLRGALASNTISNDCRFGTCGLSERALTKQKYSNEHITYRNIYVYVWLYIEVYTSCDRFRFTVKLAAHNSEPPNCCYFRLGKFAANLSQLAANYAYAHRRSFAANLPQGPQLAAGLPHLAANLPQLAVDMPQLADDLRQLGADSSPQLAADLPHLADNLSQLIANLPHLVDNLPHLTASLSQLAANLPQLADHTAAYRR